MLQEVRAILSRVDADYADLRYEIKRETIIAFNGKELIHFGSNSADGYVLRVLKRGGLSSFAFTKPEHCDVAFRRAEENALVIARHSKKPVVFAEVEPIRGIFLPELEEDPRSVPIEEKLEVTRRYNDIPLSHPGIATTVTEYREIIREKHFASTEGAEIREDLITTRLSCAITSKDGPVVQTVRLGIGGGHGFNILRNREAEFEKKTSIALALLKAEPVEAGVYRVILNPSMTGVFTHEAFGHFSEADLVEDSPSIREKMTIGAILGSEAVSITDDPTRPKQVGFYRFDDEGVPVRPTRLMEKGILRGRLHSRRTAAAFGEQLTGHCVAEDYRFPPIVRMGTIFIEPGKYSFEELLFFLEDGLYLLDHLGGQTSGENFTFGAQYGYVVKDGKLGKMIRDINMTGNLYETLKNILAVGDDLILSETGGCGKGQMNFRSCNGGPHILVDKVVIGGR